MTRVLAAAALAFVLGACRDAPRRAQPFEALSAQCRDKELGCPRPIFAVANLTKSLAYYRDTLGFTIDWEWGEPSDFASVTRAGVTLFVGVDAPSGHGALWVFARDVDALHAELKKKRAIVKMPPTNMPWGNRELHVLDPDGNLLRFAGPTKR
jgi:catechol 2,3-dioxygenase-like lactoylglutathione lyase family enzyme